MVTEVTMYKTKNGAIHTTLEAARYHERMTKFDAWYTRCELGLETDRGFEPIESPDMLKWLLTHMIKIQETFSDAYEPAKK